MQKLMLILLFIGLVCGNEREKFKYSKDIAKNETYEIKSKNYPEDVPAWTEETWELTTQEGKGLDIHCKDIRLYKSDPCGDYSVSFSDGKDTRVFCGFNFDYNIQTSTNKLTVILKTGRWNRGFLNCVVSRSGPSSHLELISMEIDSSEFGGPPGIKELTCPCGWRNKRNSGRIVGGEETDINEYPFMVRIEFGKKEISLCGGSIVTQRHVITAAHCSNKFTSDETRVTVAEHDAILGDETEHTVEFEVAKIINHPEYDEKTMKHDISIIILKTEIEFSRYAGPVCLPLHDLHAENSYAKVIGWGRPSNAERFPSSVLRDVFVRILEPKMCKKSWIGIFDTEEPTQYCVWGKAKSACTGDSGGPIVWLDPDTNRFTLAGIVSYGKSDSVGDCGNKTPRVATKVSFYITWISEVINGKESSTPALPICVKK